ncbi:hypothetical protein [Rhodococcus sp. SGAir0479]|uniref:hypothetical protein n=1 Tax=Rhodococcus sp. SGAir0479 TaxID=2567884 RepID=UPI0010CD405C|nr:hypothetical protein [Rhodococcus sp. SGAir0479]QCQ92559.1 hypothetical protein E7742_15915 [Rhodococcus sp. SGAir0479]
MNSFVPLLGSLFVSTSEYAVWALGATLATIFVVFDFGSPSLATKLASTEELTRAVSVRLFLVSMSPPLVLGLVSVLVWPLYSQHAGLAQIPMTQVVLMFAMVAVGCALRGIGLVYAGSALGAGRFTRRGIILVGGAGVQVLATVLSLLSGLGINSLGVGILCSGICQAALGLLAEYRCLSRVSTGKFSAGEINRLMILFLRAKGAVTLLGLGITQLDRWAVGLIGSPTLLAQYDIATRILVMPKVALVALAVGLIAEGSRSSTRSAALSILDRSEKLLSIAAFAMLVPAIAFAMFMQSHIETAMSIVVLTGLVALAHLANSFTIPSVFLLTGLGRPDLELRYLVPLSVSTIAVYFIAIASHNGTFFVYGWCGAMTVFSLYFVLKRKKFIREVV